MKHVMSPRPAQKEILAYRSGTMGVSAVPGSGKTWTLSLLAANLIRNGSLGIGQEVLVVTLVNSAVINFSQRISGFLSDFGLVPSLGYRIRTLHGLAHDIVKERPELAGLDVNFQIIDERESERIRVEAVYDWIKDHKSFIDQYLLPDLNNAKVAELYQKQIPLLLDQAAMQFIRTSKNLLQTPNSLLNLLSSFPGQFPLAEMGYDIYRVYQRNLEYRGAVDFDDLIGHAFRVLQLDPTLLKRLQTKWPYILEDEAQDSSLMQQKILSLLAKSDQKNNWVRVGDPNQAIYESFTTADPELLMEFLKKADQERLLPNSGRSTRSIIDLANHLVRWTSTQHPSIDARPALYPNFIMPTPDGDFQSNPESKPNQVHLRNDPYTPEEEVSRIASSVANWLELNPDGTAAILAPRNERGKKVAAELRSKHRIEPVELLSTTLATRKTTGSLVRVLTYLIDPSSSKKLASIYEVWSRDLQKDLEEWERVQFEAALIKRIPRTETFISPGPAPDWLAGLNDQTDDTISRLLEFSAVVQRWHQAVQLPIDQLILTLANDLFSSPDELSLSHKIAVFIKGLSIQHPDWEIPALIDELKSLARNERRFFIGGDGAQFNPDDHQGKVVVTTAHKAKGLEWDRVYLMAANNYNFPSGADEDRFIAEKWFIRDKLNLAAETLAQLSVLCAENGQTYLEGQATLESRSEYIRERLRLFYVSVTRAKKELVITWNSGRGSQLKPAAALIALTEYWESEGSK